MMRGGGGITARAHMLNGSQRASEHMLDEWDQRHRAFHSILSRCGSHYLLQMRERLFVWRPLPLCWLRETVLSVEDAGR